MPVLLHHMLVRICSECAILLPIRSFVFIYVAQMPFLSNCRSVGSRESASQSRERKKQRMLDMEQRCASLEDQVKALSRAVTATALENAALREELARQQMYRYSSTVMTTPATGRSRARGAKKGTGTEPAVLSSGTCVPLCKDGSPSVGPETRARRKGPVTGRSVSLAATKACMPVKARMAQLVQAVGGTVIRLADLP